MGFWIALLLAAGDGGPALEWADGVKAARETAGARNRLILLRQVHCECDGTKCPASDLLRRPAYLDHAALRTLIEDHYVLATAHAPKEADAAGLSHPSFIPAEFRRKLSQVRTLIVTPSGHVIHRLDLCPHSGDVAGELEFAMRLRTECFTAAWAPVPGWEERLRGLHAEHAFKPEAWHPNLLAAASVVPGMKPWSGYGSLDLAWQADLADAQALAKHSERLVFFYQVVGNLDKDGC